VLRFDLEAIAVNAGDAHAFACGRRATSRAPFTVSDADTSAVIIDLLHDCHDSSDEPSRTIVQ
jgi:hypothetical protein